MIQTVEFRWYADKRLPLFLVQYIVGNWIAQYENDIMVWENKVFVRNPKLVSEDGPVSRLRRWYRQFQSPNCLAMRDATDLDW